MKLSEIKRFNKIGIGTEDSINDSFVAYIDTNNHIAYKTYNTLKKYSYGIVEQGKSIWSDPIDYYTEDNQMSFVWQPMDTYVKPTTIYDASFPKCLFYCAEQGIVVGGCTYMGDRDGIKLYKFFYSEEFIEINPTHWMPIPNEPM